MLYLDGVYAEDAYGKVRFHRIKAPTVDELGVLVQRISQRVARFLERRGFLVSDEDDCLDAGGRAMQEQLPRAPLCWWTMYCLVSPFASGY